MCPPFIDTNQSNVRRKKSSCTHADAPEFYSGVGDWCASKHRRESMINRIPEENTGKTQISSVYPPRLKSHLEGLLSYATEGDLLTSSLTLG